MFLSKRNDDDDSDSKSVKPIVHTFETLRDEGEHFLHVQKYLKAITSFTKALEMKADDPYCMVSRSKCYLRTGEFTHALKDAETSLKDDNKYARGLYQKAEVLYVMGDFEQALVFYHRGHRMRTESEEFKMGIKKSEEAILNAVGSPDIITLSTQPEHLGYFYEAAEVDKAKRKVKPPPVLQYKRLGSEVVEKKPLQRKKTNAEDKTVKQLLGKLYADREYLEEYFREQDSYERKSGNGERIRDLTVECLNYLDSRSEFWQQQNPLYARRYQQELTRREQSQRSKKSSGGHLDSCEKYILKNIESIDILQSQKKHATALRQARQLLVFVEGRPNGKLDNKEQITGNLYSIMGNSLLAQGRVKRALEAHKKDLEIGKTNKLVESVSRALDNIGRVYAKNKNYRKAIEVWEEKLPQSQSQLETTWLSHEIGRCYLELDEAEKAYEMGERSLESAKEIHDEDWMLNASVLIAQSQMHLGSLDEAVESFGKAYDFAKTTKNETAQHGIENAIEQINSKIAEFSLNAKPSRVDGK